MINTCLPSFHPAQSRGYCLPELQGHFMNLCFLTYAGKAFPLWGSGRDPPQSDKNRVWSEGREPVGKDRRQWGRSRCRGNTQMLTKPLLYTQLQASSSFLLIVYALFSFQRALKVASLTLRFISLPRSTSFPSDSDHCTVLC